MNKDTGKLIIKGKIKHWEDGMPIGNGNIGGLLFGNSKNLVLSLDKGDIWDVSENPEQDENFTYTKLVELAKAGKSDEIYKIFDLPYNRPLPTKLPVGKIVFDMGEGSSHIFQTDLKRAEARCDIDEKYLKTFIHSDKPIGMIKCNNNQVKAKLVRPNFGLLKGNEGVDIDTSANTSRSMKDLRYPEPLFENKRVDGIDIEYYIQEFNGGIFYGVALAGKRSTKDAEFAFTIDFSKDKEELLNAMQQKVLDALAEGYDSLFDSHKIWWDKYNATSSLTLPDKQLERNYNIGNYLLGSASRKGFFPMPLQGLWTACDDKTLPPWHGDYHLDLNVQMTYCNYLKANHLNEGECLTDYLVSLTDRAREFAKKSYNTEGICLPSVMSIDGYALGGWPMYSFSPTNQLWLCQIIDRHYTFTRDEKFFNEVALPYLSESAKFILSLLKEDADGYLALPISTSPEIHDNTLKAFLKPNSNYDQALIMYVFQAMVRYCKKINENADIWETALSKLHPLAVNENNVYMLSREESLNESHRHQSHAMAIYPLKLINDYDAKNKAIITATLANAKKHGCSKYVGYSFTWLAEFCVANHDGDEALKYLKKYFNYYCSKNTFHVNFNCLLAKVFNINNYGPFTLEANFCALDAIQDMLFYAEDGLVEFFPAVPSKWKNASFKGFRGFDGIIVDASLLDAKLEKATITATVDCEFKIVNNLNGYSLYVGENKVNYSGKIALKAGETLTIKI